MKPGQIYQRKKPLPGKSFRVELVSVNSEVCYKVLVVSPGADTGVGVGYLLYQRIQKFEDMFELSIKNFIAYNYKNKLVKK